MKTDSPLTVCFLFCLFSFLLCDSALLTAQNFLLSGGGTVGQNGVYIQSGTHNGFPRYINVSNPGYSVYYEVYNTVVWWIDNDTSFSNPTYFDRVLYYWNGTPPPSTFPITVPASSYFWSNAGGPSAGVDGVDPLPVSTQLPTANMSFSDGTGFIPSVPSRPSTNNPIGRFKLTGSSVGGVLQSVTVSLTGTHTGASNIKLWSTASFSFSSPKLLATVATDNSSVTFNGFNSVVDNTSGTYYFVSVDLASGSTGSVLASLASQNSLSFTGANRPGSFTNAALSSGAAPLPVEISSFNASINHNQVTLNWVTASENNVHGFEVERTSSTFETLTTATLDWQKIGFISGHGNSFIPISYTFEDNNFNSGKILYRLKLLDNDGSFRYSTTVEVSIGRPAAITLLQNFPNPFNPVTKIKFQIPNDNSRVTLRVFDFSGNEVAYLVNRVYPAGYYEVEFNAAGLASGVYLYKLTADQTTLVKKLIVLK